MPLTPEQLERAREIVRRNRAARAKRRRISDIGDRLEAILAERFGKMSCGDCRTAVRRLNQKTANQVRAERAATVEDIYSRRDRLPKRWQRWAATLAPATAKRTIGHMLDDAIRTSKEFASDGATAVKQ